LVIDAQLFPGRTICAVFVIDAAEWLLFLKAGTPAVARAQSGSGPESELFTRRCYLRSVLKRIVIAG